MRRRKRSLVIISSAAAIFLLLLAAFRHHPEPSYDGKPLSYWVIRLDNSDVDAEASRATNAIAHIGTKALPQLLHWIQYERPEWRDKVGALIEKLPPHAFSEKVAERITNPRRAELASGAAEAFKVLGPTALPALNALSRLMNKPAAPETAAAATEALCHLGTNALPPLLAVLNNPEHPCRVGAVISIDQMPGLSDAPQLVVPTLLACLSETNSSSIGANAAQALAELQCERGAWLSALAAAMSVTNSDSRSSDSDSRSSRSLIIDALASAENAIPALTNSLTDANPNVRSLARYLLDQIPPEQLTNRPVRIWHCF